MKRAYVFALLAVAGCNVFPLIFGPPEDMNVVVGGISNTQPFYGDVSFFGKGDADLILASCGCGDWRVLVTPKDGSPRSQFKILYYCDGDYQTDIPVTLYGDEEGGAMSAMLDQQTGVLDGALRVGDSRSSFTAFRGTNHTDSAEACAACHTGEDPVYPQPDNHPAFTLNPANCLDCHSVNGQ